MYSFAHRVYAIGIAMIIAFWWDLGILVVIALIMSGSFMGVLPDYDQKLNIPHRTITHTPLFVLLVSIIMTFFIFTIFGFLQIYIPSIKWLIKFKIDTNMTIPFPIFDKGWIYPNAWWLSSIVGVFLSILCAGLSHLAIDTDTKSGLKLFGKDYKGIYASEGGANDIFIIIGYIMIIFGIGGILLVNLFQIFNILWFNVFIIIALIISFIVISSSLVVRKKRDIKHLYCGKVKGLEVCSFNECIKVDGIKYCFNLNSTKKD